MTNTTNVQILVRLYRRHEQWARRSGFAPMEWIDFKRERQANPLCRPAMLNTGA